MPGDLLGAPARRGERPPGLRPGRAQGRVDTMRTAFPDALVEGYEPLIPVMTNQANDRHVLAAAVRGGAEIIMTNNIKDFPDAALSPFDITAVTADDSLLDQLELHPAVTRACFIAMVQARTRPPVVPAELLPRFGVIAPKFAHELGRTL
ncbi:PIN domain-containing protein [Prauserella flavalba]|nr:PIN domain-containing protein [Prauserella flavalba]